MGETQASRGRGEEGPAYHAMGGIMRPREEGPREEGPREEGSGTTQSGRGGGGAHSLWITNRFARRIDEE